MANKRARGVDAGAVFGLVVGSGAIVGGLLIEGGGLRDILQESAAVIVLGGTLGAVALTMPFKVLKRAAGRIGSVLTAQSDDSAAIIEEIVTYAAKARKGGMVSLEPDVPNVADPFLRKAMSLAVDGVQLHALRDLMELDMRMEEAENETDAKLFEAAGGYAPTIGIIGAVIGLIQVMKHLNDLTKVGFGIAVAFVATIYGVAFANLFCLPAGQKIRYLGQEAQRRRELMLEGVSAMVEGMNPRLIRRKLQSYVRDGSAEKAAPAAAPLHAVEPSVDPLAGQAR
jgi:chemotaxis protein MotA